MKPSNVGKTVDPLLRADEIDGIGNKNFGCCIWKTVILLLGVDEINSSDD